MNISIVAVLSLVGCAGPSFVEQLGPEHPANPLAAGSSPPTPSQTLMISGAGPAATSLPSTSPAATLYACPMHPEVTSPDPEARCPKCKMKINKPVQPANAPAKAPANGHQHGGAH